MAFDPYALPVPDLGLRCMTCGYPLAGLTSHRCPECGTAFEVDDFIPKGDFPLVVFDGQFVRVTPEIAELLRRHRIPFTQDAGLADAMLFRERSIRRGGSLGVPRAEYFQVIDLLKRRRAGEPILEESADRPDNEWACKGCSELNPGRFDICWNCGTDRPESA